MGIFSSIKNAIFGSDDKQGSAAADQSGQPAGEPERAAIAEVDVVARISAIPGADKLNWQSSIVDLMKLLDLDASYANRKQLAQEMGNHDYSGSAEDNIALHKAVMQAIADAGGIVPDHLKH